MTTQTLTYRDLLQDVLQILEVSDENQRERMIDDVQHAVQTQALLLSLKALPDADQKCLSKISLQEIQALLPTYVTETVIQQALREATDDIIPTYISELAETATETQKQQIEKLLGSVR